MSCMEVTKTQVITAKDWGTTSTSQPALTGKTHDHGNEMELCVPCVGTLPTEPVPNKP